MVKQLLEKLKHTEFCEPNCFGCCGDGEIDFTCKTVVENFEKELLKYYIPKETYTKLLQENDELADEILELKLKDNVEYW